MGQDKLKRLTVLLVIIGLIVFVIGNALVFSGYCDFEEAYLIMLPIMMVLSYFGALIRLGVEYGNKDDS